jgi:hypothetical protein
MKPLYSLALLVVIHTACVAQAALRSVTALTSSNLPIVVINTHGVSIVDEPKITADMGVIYNGEGVRNAVTDPFNHYNGKIAIEIRGSSSQMFEKKQYGFNTVDSVGGDYDVPLLGFPTEHTWILSAQYNDKTLMRDALTYILSNRMGRYASRTKYCEVVINGEYRGVYLLMEKIKRAKSRVNISKMTPADTAGDNLTGGYIFKIDKADKPTDTGWDAMYPPFGGPSRQNRMYLYHYPDPEEIVPQQIRYIQEYERKFEIAMASASYRDTAIGYPALLDVKSFVDMVIMNELTKNVDGYRLSTFLYKDRTSKNDKLFAGPYWDYNLGLGNCDYQDAYLRQGWQLDYISSDGYADAYKPPFWWKKVWADPAFKKQVAIRWKDLRANLLATSTLFSTIDSLSAVVNEGQQRNFERWPILGVKVWPNYFVGSSFADEVNWMKGWIVNRVDWLDQTLAPLATGVRDERPAVPATSALEQNYPNPFNPATQLRYTTNARQHVSIVVYDVLGRAISHLVDEVIPAGQYTVEWTAARVPSGVYVCRMHAGTSVSVIRMTVVK